MNLEQIQALNLDDLSTLVSLLRRMFDEPEFLILDDEELTSYERLDMLNKPSLQDFQLELDVWKDELTQEYNAKVAEESRVEALKNRWDALEDIQGVLSEAGMNVTNPALELKRIIDEDDEITMQLLEQAHASWQPKLQNKMSLLQIKRLGKQARKACEEVLDVIAGYNLSRNLTPSNVDAIQSSFSQIESALKSNRPDKARTLIEAASPDGALVTEEMKQNILDILSEYGF